MAKITLDTINAGLDKEYGPTDVDLAGFQFNLRHPIRISDAEREHLKSYMEKKDEDNEEKSDEVKEAEARARFSGILVTLADDKEAAQGMCDALDLLVLAQVFKQWSEAQKLGKASKSRS